MRAISIAAVTAIAAAAAWPAMAAGSGEPSLWSEFLQWIVRQQRFFHQELTDGLKQLKAGDGWLAGYALISASFLYGLFHAAGPGHGKVVLTTYLVTQRQKVARGIAMACASALCQGLVAVVLVYGLIFVAGWLPRETTAAVTWSERMSYGLVGLIGVWLVWRALSVWLPLQKAAQGHGHHDQHDHHHHHGGCSGCGHNHAPDPGQLSGDWRSSLGVVLSIGLRPCSGAVLVLVFAKALSLEAAGVLAVLAMSAGTAIAVAVLALLATHARELAVSMAERQGSRLVLHAGTAVAAAGGVFLVIVGMSLLSGSFAPAHPLGL